MAWNWIDHRNPEPMSKCMNEGPNRIEATKRMRRPFALPAPHIVSMNINSMCMGVRMYEWAANTQIQKKKNIMQSFHPNDRSNCGGAWCINASQSIPVHSFRNFIAITISQSASMCPVPSNKLLVIMRFLFGRPNGLISLSFDAFIGPMTRDWNITVSCGHNHTRTRGVGQQRFVEKQLVWR